MAEKKNARVDISQSPRRLDPDPWHVNVV